MDDYSTDLIRYTPHHLCLPSPLNNTFARKNGSIVSVWGEWTSPEFSSFVRVVRPEKRLGVAGAKNFGAQQASSEVENQKPQYFQISTHFPGFLVLLTCHLINDTIWLNAKSC